MKKNNSKSAEKFYQKAKKYYLNALDIMESSNGHMDDKRALKVKENFNKSVEYLNKALDVLEDNAAIANTNLLLGCVYIELEEFETAKKSLIDSVVEYTLLAIEYPKKYDLDLAQTCSYLGECLSNLEINELELKNEIALELTFKLADRGIFTPVTTESSMFEIEIPENFSECLEIQECGNSESFYFKAIEIYSKLANDNPAEYEPHLASGYYELVIFYTNLNRQQDADLYLEKAYEIAKKHKDNPFCRIICKMVEDN